MLLNTLLQPDADIARFVRVTQAEDGMIDIFIADNYREDFKVHHFVSPVQKAFPGRTRWASLSLDEIANVALPASGDAPAHSVNQQRVLSYQRLTCILPLGVMGENFAMLKRGFTVNCNVWTASTRTKEWRWRPPLFCRCVTSPRSSFTLIFIRMAALLNAF